MEVLLPALLAAAAILAIVLAALLVRERRRRPAGTAPSPPAAAAPPDRGADPPADDAFELLPVVAVRVDAGTRLLDANARARQRFPFLRPGQLLLESFGEHRLSERVLEVLEAGRGAAFELRLFDDDRRTYRVEAEPCEVAGRPACLVFMTDLTEAVAYQELRSQFVANVSHELRTPITGLRGLLEALADDGIDPETHARFVGRAVAETQRLEALITDILFLSELEAAPRHTVTERADLCQAARDATEALAALADETGGRVELHAEGVAEVPISDRMARTVVQNLLENALKYGGPNARAVVDVRRDPAAGTATVAVADDGPGIAERHLPHVFERFYRADPSRSKRLGGTGLGLSLVKHIAERAGGHAEAASREGFGTTVTVVIPLADGGPAAPGAAATGRPNRLAPGDTASS